MEEREVEEEGEDEGQQGHGEGPHQRHHDAEAGEGLRRPRQLFENDDGLWREAGERNEQTRKGQGASRADSKYIILCKAL